MGTPSEELQTAVVAALKADAAVAAEVGDRVFDGRPPLALAGPTITLGPSDFVSEDMDCIAGRIETMQLDVWVEAGGRVWPARVIVDKIKAALHHAPLALDEHALVGIEVVPPTRAFLDPDGLTAHGIVTVQAEIEER